MIEMHGIHKYYQTGDQSLHVLKGVDMQVREGELVSIMCIVSVWAPSEFSIASPAKC